MRRTRTLSLALVSMLLVGSVAMADTVFIGTLAYKDVKIKGVKGDELLFLTSGNEAHKPIKDVTRIQLADEPALSAAEEAYAGKQWDKAADGYLKTLKSSNKDWLKDWSAQRLLLSANEAKRVDAAVTAYLAMLQRDPATASKNKPTIPTGKSALLDAAANEVDHVMSGAALNDDQKQALLSLQLEIAKARGDEKAQAAAVQSLTKIDTENTSGASDPAALKVVGDTKLSIATAALDQKNYQKAIDTIEQNRNTFVDPKQQADALWVLAQSRYALAQQKNEPAALKDAALGYMRIVANFKDAVGAPHVPESLLATGEILEKLKDNDGAMNVYNQLASAYPETPAGAKAKESADRLKAAAGKQG
jgi:TolA-binding protein